jgi:dTDP-4-dehydrorhamnose 3,5-epimerase
VEVSPVARIAGALLFRPKPFTDERGFFCRTFDADVLAAAGLDPAAFIQDSLSRSVRGVVRGLHVRRGLGEAKLVRCSYGAIFDVVVDLRPSSPTYRNWESFELRDDEQVAVYIPAGCAHGFQALTEPADVCYRIDRAHDPSEDVSIAFDDPELAIPWPLPTTIISQRDRAADSLTAALKLLS